MRRLGLTLLACLLISCGGGGGGGGGGVVGGGGALVGAAGTAGSPQGGSAGAAGAGTGDPGDAPGASGGSAAGGGSAGAAGATASNGTGDGSGGVGSGGTGVSSASVGVGSVDGFGSVILNGVRYEVGNARIAVADNRALAIGMTARVAGSLGSDLASGVAQEIVSSPELRGPVDGVDGQAGTFDMLGMTVETNQDTVWADGSGIASVRAGDTLQVWALPTAPGVMRATRVEHVAAGQQTLVSGFVQSPDPAALRFTLGRLVISVPSPLFRTDLLRAGTLVRVTAASLPLFDVLNVQSVQGWYDLPQIDGASLQLSGVVSDFASLGRFSVLGRPVDASGARINGGPAASIGNGVRVDVVGTVRGGVLQAVQVRIRTVPGTGGPASFHVIGAVGAFRSASDFRVQGQPIDASQASFAGGTAGNLRNGVQVDVAGARVVDGVLIATSVRFP